MSQLLEEYFQDILKLYPSFGSFLGLREYDAYQENTLDPKHVRKYESMQYRYLNKFQKYKGARDIDYQILQWILQDNIEGLDMPLDLLPMSSFENPVLDFTFMNASLYPLETGKDLRNLVFRHKVFIDYLHGCIRNMKLGIQQGIVQPKMICEKMIKSIELYLLEEKYLLNIPKHIIASHPQAYTAYQHVMALYEATVRKLLQFLQDVYLPACRSTFGICHLPNGHKMYKYIVKSQLTLSIPIKDIHELGKKEVARISKDMMHLRNILGYPSSMSLPKFYAAMLANPKHSFKSQQSVLQAYRAKQKEIRREIIPKYFDKNVITYDIEHVPKSMESTAAGAFYMPGSVDLKRKGVFYINLRNVKENPTYAVTSLTLHEGEPGHHYQYQYMIEKQLPFHRIYCVNGNAFVEGWALYAESLGNYEDRPKDYFGKLTYELFRAVRLVVDTGIHAYGWSYDKAVNYMKRHLAMSNTEIETEVQRYICMPGQALCYKIGEYKIQSWKKQFVAKFGASDIALQKFHTALLEDGVLPLQVLEKKIMRMINDVTS